MTEDDARGKWCPMSRAVVTPEGDIYPNKMGNDYYCIASDCMAWRWETSPRRLIPPSGFCGLAGKP